MVSSVFGSIVYLLPNSIVQRSKISICSPTYGAIRFIPVVACLRLLRAGVIAIGATSQRLAFDRAAMHWLRHSQWHVIPSDKLGGFVLLHHDDYVLLHEELLSGAWYEELPPQRISAIEFDRFVSEQYTKLGKAIEDCASFSSKSICGSLKFSTGCMHGSLINTCKHHKLAGEALLRVVHASSCHVFASMLHWIQMTLDNILLRCEHLMVSSDAFVQTVSGFPVHERDLILLADLKDFFMTGRSRWFADCCAKLCPIDIRQAMFDAVRFVLEHRIIVSALLPGRVFPVACGTGMGLRCSGSISSACLLYSVEHGGPQLAKPNSTDRFRIKLYHRYVDNLFFIIEGGDADTPKLQ